MAKGQRLDRPRTDRREIVEADRGDLVMLIVAVVALHWSFKTTMVSAQFGSFSAGLRVSMVWFLLAVPLGFSLMILRLVQSMTRDLRSLRDRTPVYEGDRRFD